MKQDGAGAPPVAEGSCGGERNKAALNATGAEPSSPGTSRVPAGFACDELLFPPPSPEARSTSALSPPPPAVAAASTPPQQNLEVMKLSLLGFRDTSQGQNYQTCHDPEIDPIDLTGSDVVSTGGGGCDRNWNGASGHQCSVIWNFGETKRKLFRRGFQYTLDGSLVNDRDFVFVLPADDRDPETKVAGGRILQIDYFHGLIGGIPIAQMMDDDETNVWATEMLAVKFIRQLMRTWFDQTKSVKFIAALLRTWFEQTKSGKASLRR